MDPDNHRAVVQLPHISDDLYMLCNACRKALQKRNLRSESAERTVEWIEPPAWKETQTHHQSYEEFMMAVEQACRICVALHNKLIGNTREKWRISEPRTIQPFSVLNNDTDSITIWDGTETVHVAVQYLPKPSSDKPIHTRQDLKQANSTADQSVVELAEYWLQNCVASHNQCKQEPSKQWVPKRLLHIQGKDVRLLISKEETSSGVYATLSHRWGDKQDFLILNEQNIDILKKGMTWRSLPKTFANAVELTQQLGIEYLWIDSLCILQSGRGSREDWLEHTNQMAMVYQNCVLNIAAHAAENPHHGLFVERKPEVVCEMTVLDKHGVASSIYLDELCGFASLRYTDLSKRGWVVQERLLSPRVLHMGTAQISWECTTVPIACECQPYGDVYRAACYSGAHPFDFSHSGLRPSLSYVDDIRYKFLGLIRHYSQCGLSFPDTDKLVAFTAIAQKAASLVDCKYAAGFLQSGLPYDLIWSVNFDDLRDGTAGRSKGDYRVPSWSWASIDGPVSLHLGQVGKEKDLTTFVQVISYEPVLVDPNNTFGNLLPGTKLTLSGHIFPLTSETWQIEQPNPNFWYILAFSLAHDGDEKSNTMYRVHIWPDDMDFISTKDQKAELFLLPISSESGWGDWNAVSGLILSKTSGSQGYCRIALFDTRWSTATRVRMVKSEWEQFFEDAIDIF